MEIFVKSVITPNDAVQRQILNGLKSGCYFLRLSTDVGVITPESEFSGSLRIERVSEDAERIELRVSSDLYADTSTLPQVGVIPIFDRLHYRAFITLKGGDGVIRFADNRLQIKVTSQTLTSMTWNDGPSLRLLLDDSVQNGVHRFNVELRDSSDTKVGSGTATWLSDDFRRISVQPVHTSGAPIPINNGSGVSWESLFRKAGFFLGFNAPIIVQHPMGQATWKLGELHETLVALAKAGASVDKEWIVYLFCVPTIEGVDRGIMFEFGSTDKDGTPREGSVVAADWEIPDDPAWGSARNKRFGDVLQLYFRSAAHEIGHALNLQHSITPSVNRLMTPTDQLLGMPGFPEALPIKISDDEHVEICHQPDPVVRPGGLPYPATISSSDKSEPLKSRPTRAVRLTLCPLLPSFPLGAPVRVRLTLGNQGRTSVLVPESLGFSRGALSVTLQGPNKARRQVKSTVRVCEGFVWQEFAPRDERDAAFTLYRNHSGPLFEEPGEYTLRVRIPVRRANQLSSAMGQTRFAIEPAKTKHVRLSQRALDSRCIQRILTIGGEYHPAAKGLMRKLLQDHELAPHFEIIEAKRLGIRHFNRMCDITTIACLVKSTTVMTHQELERMIEIIEQGICEGGRALRAARTVLKVLSTKISELSMLPSTKYRLRRKAQRLLRRLNTNK